MQARLQVDGACGSRRPAWSAFAAAVYGFEQMFLDSVEMPDLPNYPTGFLRRCSGGLKNWPRTGLGWCGLRRGGLKMSK